MKTRRLAAMLIAALSVTLCPSLKAQTSGGGWSGSNFQIGPSGAQVYGGIIGGAAAVGVITYLAIHYSKKREITGCVASLGSGMTVTDEKDHNTYLLSGETANVAPGTRVKLAGKKIKPKHGNSTLDWNTTKVKKNFGACPVGS